MAEEGGPARRSPLLIAQASAQRAPAVCSSVHMGSRCSWVGTHIPVWSITSAHARGEAGCCLSSSSGVFWAALRSGSCRENSDRGLKRGKQKSHCRRYLWSQCKGPIRPQPTGDTHQKALTTGQYQEGFKKKNKIKERNVAKQPRKPYEIKINSNLFPEKNFCTLQALQQPVSGSYSHRLHRASSAGQNRQLKPTVSKSGGTVHTDPVEEARGIFHMPIRWETYRANEYGSSTGCERINLKGSNCRIATACGWDGSTKERVISKGRLI